MANKINQLALNLPHPDAVTNAQVTILLNIAGMMIPMLINPARGHETIPGESNPAGEVSLSAEATFINACNRLDDIINDASRWGQDFQKVCEARAAQLHIAEIEQARASQAAAAEIISPHFRYRPSIARTADGGWVAFVGDPETPNSIAGMGRSPDEAVRNFDHIFKGSVPDYMVQWLAAREQALEAGNPSPPTPENTNETTVVPKRNRKVKNSPRGRKTDKGDSGNAS